MQVRKHQLELDHGTADWYQIGKGVRQAVYCHPAYLAYLQSVSCKILCCIKHKLESRLPRRSNNNLKYADDTTLMEGEKEELKSLLTKVKKVSEKAGLKLNSQKNIMALGSVTS